MLFCFCIIRIYICFSDLFYLKYSSKKVGGMIFVEARLLIVYSKCLELREAFDREWLSQIPLVLMVTMIFRLMLQLRNRFCVLVLVSCVPFDVYFDL